MLAPPEFCGLLQHPRHNRVLSELRGKPQRIVFSNAEYQQAFLGKPVPGLGSAAPGKARVPARTDFCCQGSVPPGVLHGRQGLRMRVPGGDERPIRDRMLAQQCIEPGASLADADAESAFGMIDFKRRAAINRIERVLLLTVVHGDEGTRWPQSLNLDA